MVTSSPHFSKKPRSSAIGRPIWSMPVTMPALSLTGVCAVAVAKESARAHNTTIQRILSSPQRFDLAHPVGAGDSDEVRCLYSAHFDGVVFGARHSAESL